MIFATMGPKIYNMISSALNGPCISEARKRLYEYKAEIGLSSSFLGDEFVGNEKYIDEYKKAIEWPEDEPM